MERNSRDFKGVKHDEQILLQLILEQIRLKMVSAPKV